MTEGDRVEDLERRLGLVEDHLAILAIEGTYARAFDQRQGDEWAALFTEDGTYESRQTPPSLGPPVVSARGTEGLARFCDESPFSGIHLPSIPQVVVQGDRATSRIHFTFHAANASGDLESTVGTTVGYYDVAYARTPAGWRIARRVTTRFARTSSAVVGYRPVGAFEQTYE